MRDAVVDLETPGATEPSVFEADPAIVDLRDQPKRHLIILEGDIDVATAPRLLQQVRQNS